MTAALLALAQIVSVDAAAEPLVARAGDHADRTIQLTAALRAPDGGVWWAGGRPDRLGLVERRGGWRREFEGDTINGIALSPDGRAVAAAGADGVVTLLDAATGAVRRRLEGHAAAVLCVAFSPDGTTVASGSADRSIRLWSAADGAVRHAIANHAEPVGGLAFTPDGRRLASASLDRSVRIWEPGTARLVRIVRARDAEALSVAAAADGRRLAAGYEDGGVAIVDVEEGTVIHSLRPFESPVWALAADRDVVAGSWAGQVVRIDPATGVVRRD